MTLCDARRLEIVVEPTTNAGLRLAPRPTTSCGNLSQADTPILFLQRCLSAGDGVDEDMAERGQGSGEL